MVESTKHVRVDNWGVFFLQRLQMFFNKTDYCDLTLQFDGNVQLKVHRLVMNACTDYFQVLEQTCDVVDDNIILMPPDLQADVILPIVNFMYTGTLEYHPIIYDRLVRTAELMNIPILIKLLEAHKAVPQNNLNAAQKRTNIPQPSKPPKRMLNTQAYAKKVPNSVPNTLPGRKLPLWKRKAVPTARSTITPRDRPVTVPSVDNMGCGATSGVGALVSSYKGHVEPVHIDNEPKPTRFEWPDGEDDRLKTESYMESSAFENLTSYSSSPLIKGEDTERIPIYEDLRYTTSSTSPSQIPVKRRPGQSPYTGRRPNQSMQQQITFDDDADDIRYDSDDQQDPDDPDYHPDVIPAASSGVKRAAFTTVMPSGAKRVRFNEKENSSTKGVSKEVRAGSSKGVMDREGEGHLDHSVLVQELLKKYPNLAKTNKNIKLKIMTKSGDKQIANIGRQHISQSRAPPDKVMVGQGPSKGQPIYKQPKAKYSGNVVRKQLKTNTSGKKCETDGPWLCDKCEVPPDAYHLYYLYRKHMTDVHQVQFSQLMCKFCGKSARNDRAISFHMYTVHGASVSNIIGPPFPQCDRCSFSALSDRRLAIHKQLHRSSHVQCLQCKVGFTGLHALSTHHQITSHITRETAHANPGMISYDCQYCTRHWQNSATLFVHLRTAHREEARRDGIVSIDEDPEDDEEELEELEAVSEDVQVVAEDSVTDSSIVDKENTVDELKDPETQEEEEGSVRMQMTNAGITTTLGLVDIVVLDENQQYILQSSNGDLEQSEFILPQITGSFVHQGQQVITTSAGQVHQNSQQQTTAHITQLKQSANQQGVGASTTDELVMVLTDHDYNDETTDANGQTLVEGQSNGNIVVLYSHPVQGGSDLEGRAHVESGGSLLVQTAEGQVLEIRNSHPDLVDHSSQSESIELIQREINSSEPQHQHILIQEDASEEQLQETHEEHLQHEEESVYQEDESTMVETEAAEQEEQQVMLVVAEDEEESPEEAAQQLEEEPSVDEQDSVVVLRSELEEDEEDNGQDVCGGNAEVVQEEHVHKEPEAMEVDEEIEEQEVVTNDVTTIEATDLNRKSPELATIQEEEAPQDDKEAYHEQYVQEVPSEEEVNANQDFVEEQSAIEEAVIIKEGTDTEEAHYSPEAMEVDCGQVETAEELTHVETTEELDDSIIEHSQSIDQQLSQEGKGNVADSTFEEDDNEDNEVLQNVPHVTGEDDLNQEETVTQEASDVAQETLDETEGEEHMTETSKNEDEEQLNGEVLPKENNDVVENDEDPNVTLDSDQIERTMENIHANEEATATDINNSKSTPQNSTIALLDEWEDTEDSSSQDKNCQTPVKTTSMTSAVNKLINDDWDDDE